MDTSLLRIRIKRDIRALNRGDAATLDLPGDGHERYAVAITESDLDSLVVVALGGAGCRTGRDGDEFSPRRTS